MSRLPPARAMALMAPFHHWPGADERFTWPGSASREHWESAAERDAAFRRALAAYAAPQARIVLIFHTAESALVLAAADADRAASVLLEPLRDTLWVRPLRDGEWLVEVSFMDAEVCGTLSAVLA